MKRSKLLPYIGCYVKIEWTRPEDDWPWFTLLDVGEKFVFLRGEDSPDGMDEHIGDEFKATMREIKTIEVAKRKVRKL